MVLPASGTLSFQSIETEWLIGTAITKSLNGNLGPLIAISASAPTSLGGSFYGKAYARAVTSITQGTTTSSSIVLNWSGGAGATSFSITSSPATTTQTASASGYTFTGLAASTAYTFTIVSKNAQGVAGQSATSGSFTTSSSGGALYSMAFPFTFTNMGATGRSGPTAITYSPIPGNGTAYVLALTGGIQNWTVPVTRSYTFTIAGAGVTNPRSASTVKTGNGVVLTSVSISLTAGHVIKILVGQSGITFTGGLQPGCGGAGGTFVYNNTTSTMLFIAGGAGGVGFQTTGAVNSDGSTTITGKSGSSGGTGGTGPNGGIGGNRGTGGAGSVGNGGAASAAIGTVPQSFTNGGTGGLYSSGGENAPPAGSTNGGFGGGGFGAGGAGGGGGGYGGGGGGNRSSQGACGGGGATYNINNPAGPNGSATNAGMGYVTVT